MHQKINSHKFKCRRNVEDLRSGNFLTYKIYLLINILRYHSDFRSMAYCHSQCMSLCVTWCTVYKLYPSLSLYCILSEISIIEDKCSLPVLNLHWTTCSVELWVDGINMILFEKINIVFIQSWIHCLNFRLIYVLNENKM